jgi:hypothetical protein
MVIEANNASSPSIWECFYRILGISVVGLLIGGLLYEKRSRPSHRLK